LLVLSYTVINNEVAKLLKILSTCGVSRVTILAELAGADDMISELFLEDAGQNPRILLFALK
jgi:hypothetical protein